MITLLLFANRSMTSLDSRNHVLNKLQSLHRKELDNVREAFIKNSHTRFKKSFSYHLHFGKKEAYVKEIMAADLDKLAGIIGICGFLMQTKVYLFWGLADKLNKENEGAHMSGLRLISLFPIWGSLASPACLLAGSVCVFAYPSRLLSKSRFYRLQLWLLNAFPCPHNL